MIECSILSEVTFLDDTIVALGEVIWLPTTKFQSNASFSFLCLIWWDHIYIFPPICICQKVRPVVCYRHQLILIHHEYSSSLLTLTKHGVNTSLYKQRILSFVIHSSHLSREGIACRILKYCNKRWIKNESTFVRNSP